MVAVPNIQLKDAEVLAKVLNLYQQIITELREIEAWPENAFVIGWGFEPDGRLGSLELADDGETVNFVPYVKVAGEQQ